MCLSQSCTKIGRHFGEVWSECTLCSAFSSEGAVSNQTMPNRSSQGYHVHSSNRSRECGQAQDLTFLTLTMFCNFVQLPNEQVTEVAEISVHTGLRSRRLDLHAEVNKCKDLHTALPQEQVPGFPLLSASLFPATVSPPISCLKCFRVGFLFANLRCNGKSAGCAFWRRASQLDKSSSPSSAPQLLNLLAHQLQPP